MAETATTESTETTTEREETKPFASFIQEQRRGALHTELSEQLADLVHACVQTGKKGKLTMTVAIAPAKDAEGTIYITDDVKVAAPKPDAKPSIFFTDSHGNVSRTNPRQPELPLRPVDGGGGRADDGTDESRAARGGRR